MIYTMLAKKKGMTSIYDSRGRRAGATILEVGPNFITQIKTTETKDGYEAVQLGFLSKKSVRKPQQGHLTKAQVNTSLRWLREVRIKNNRNAQVKQDLENLQLGQEIKVGDIFLAGDSVKVTGMTKGKGFQGGVRRHGFAGGPKTHGQSDRHRAPGSIGATTTPGRVFKGKKMAGHMGLDTASYTGLEVIKVDQQNNLMIVKGGIPGPINGLIVIEKQGQIKGYVAPEVEEEVVEMSGAEEQVTEEVSKGEETAVEASAEMNTAENIKTINSEDKEVSEVENKEEANG